ncbi:MAG: SusC/RagA family TonB-linked outer membrane protein [Lewinellaceae bacterium]|nr:SusC/RagA family TonB-linked outer membrane protein [Lewinellaceae bacterium]
MKYFKLKPLIALACFVLLGSSIAFSQRQISGTVTDGENGEPLIGASVRAVGAPAGSVTDIEGRYTFAVPDGVTQIEVSYTGYTSQTFDIGTTNVRDVVLLPGLLLEETVVIGYGVVKKEDATGAILAVGTKDFNKGAINSPQELIVGKIAGVQVTPNADPGGGATIRIRGGSSLSASNDPLIVIDGVPVGNETVSGDRNPLNIINPNDIETFTVLKDASATAIYGSRASNGVIIITTKKGSLKRKIGVDYSNNFSFSTPANRREVLDGDAYRALIAERFPDSNHPARALLGTNSTDWQDEIYQTAFGMDHNLAVAGGIGSFPYRVSLGFTDRDGILKTDNFNRLTGAVNLTPTFFDNRLQVSANLKAMRTNNFFANRGAIGAAILFDPTKPVLDANSPYGGYFTHLQTDGTPNTLAQVNPVAQLFMQNDESTVNRYVGNVQVDYRFGFLPELRANLNVGYDKSDSEGSVKTPVNYAGGYRRDDQGNDDGGSTRTYTQERKNELVEFYLNYVKPIGNTKLDVMGGYSWQHFYFEDSSRTVSARNTRVIDPGFFNPREYYLLSLFGRLNYTINDRYLFTFTLRRDGTSRFSPDNRWGMFPSAAFAWKIIDGRNGFMNKLKLRLSYGETGQQDIGTDYYPYLARYQSSLPTADYQLGDQYYTTVRPNGYDAKIKWEQTATYNAGLDYEILNGRVFGSLEYYFRKTTDLINFIPVAAGTNLTNFITTNVGDLENRGVELSINTIPYQTDKATWEIGANFTANRNKITRLTATDDPNYRGVATGGIDGGVGNNIQIHSVGFPANSFYVYEQVYNEDGLPIEGLFVDRNEDGQITPADQYRFKKPVADLLVGFYTSLTVGRFDISTGGRASFGNFVYNNGQSNQTAFNNLYQSTGYLNNIQTSYTGIGFDVPSYFSDHFIQEASFLRFDHVTLGYNFAKVRFFRNLRIYGSVQNPILITNYQGIDPEVFNGIDNNLYPRAVTYLFGLNASF